MVFGVVCQAFAGANQSKKVVEEKDLKPSAENSVKLDKVKLVKYSDGSCEIQGASDNNAFGAPAQYYRISVDQKNATYKTESMPIPDKYKKYVTDNIAKEKTTVTQPLSTESTASTTASTTAAQYFSVTMIMDTEDIPQENLAETNNYLSWTGNGGYVTYNSWDYSYWANPETNAYTTWYVDWPNCIANGPYYNSEHYIVYNDITGQYINWDWLYDDQATYTKHWTRIKGYGSTYGYEFNSRHWGESGSILQTDVFVNGIRVQ